MCHVMKQAAVARLYSACLCMYLIPAVGSVRGIDEESDDLGLGQKGSSSPWGLLWGKVVCTLFKQEIRGNIRGHREKVHVPEATDKLRRNINIKLTSKHKLPRFHNSKLKPWSVTKQQASNKLIIWTVLHLEFSGWLWKHLCQLSVSFMGQFRQPYVC